MPATLASRCRLGSPSATGMQSGLCAVQTVLSLVLRAEQTPSLCLRATTMKPHSSVTSVKFWTSSMRWSRRDNGQRTPAPPCPFLIPNITTSERSPALLPTLATRWEWPRAASVVEWNGRHNIAWEMFVRSLLAVLNEWVGNRSWRWSRWTCGRCPHRQGATPLVVDLCKAFEKVQLIVVWNCAFHFGSPQRVLRVRCGNFAHDGRGDV